jgi:hypothetical protein
MEVRPELPPATPLDLPATNSEIGITLGSVPDHLIAAFNSGDRMMLVESQNRYSRVFLRADPVAGPLDATRYHDEARSFIEGYGGGRQIDTGTIGDAPFGAAAWSSARFWEDGAIYDQVELVSPHPRGTGLLFVRAVYPEGETDAAAKIQELRDLLTRIQPSAG